MQAVAIASSASRTIAGASITLILIGRSANTVGDRSFLVLRLVSPDKDDVFVESVDVGCLCLNLFRYRIGHMIFNP